MLQDLIKPDILYIQELLKHSLHQPENLSIAESMCLKLINQQPGDYRCYQMLSFILIKTSRHAEALHVLKQLLALLTDPVKSSKCLTDIGDLLLQLNQPVEAEASFSQAVTLNPEHSIAYYKLGVLQATDKRFKQAILNYRAAIQLDPANISYLNNLAQSLAHNSSSLEEAVNVQTRAVNLVPDNHMLKNNLGLMLFQHGDFQLAQTIFENSISTDPLNWKMWERLFDSLLCQQKYSQLQEKILTLFAQHSQLPQELRKRAYFQLMLIAYIQGNYDVVAQYLRQSAFLYVESTDKMKWATIFHVYLNQLLNYRYSNKVIYEGSYEDDIYVVGESHCLSPAHTIIHIDAQNYRLVPFFVSGCKVWHIISPYKNQYQSSFQILYNAVPHGAMVIFCFGEIDCRIDEGVMGYYRKNPELSLDVHLQNMIKQYLDCLEKSAIERQIKIMIQGVPAPYADISSYPITEQQVFIKMIKSFNDILRAECKHRNIKFLDVYALTVNEHGLSNGRQHLDTHHLKPDYIREVL